MSSRTIFWRASKACRASPSTSAIRSLSSTTFASACSTRSEASTPRSLYKVPLLLSLLVLERNVVEVLFVQVHVVPGGLAGTSTAALTSVGGGATFATGVAPSEKLDVIGHDVDFGTLGPILGLP